jgi:hypothetical protein
MTDLGSINLAVWSPDGRELLLEARYEEAFRTDASRLADRRSARRIPHPPNLDQVEPLAWSAAGTIVAAERDAQRSGEIKSLGIWDLQANTYRSFELPVVGRTFGAVAGFLPDGKRFVARSRDGIAIVDAETGTWRVVRPVVESDFIRMTADGRVLLIESERFDSDIWLLEREAP